MRRQAMVLGSLLLALFVVRATRMPSTGLGWEIGTWLLAFAVLVLTILNLRFKGLKWVLPTIVVLCVALLAIPPSDRAWLHWVPDSVVALLLLAFLNFLYEGDGTKAPRPETPTAEKAWASIDLRLISLGLLLLAVDLLPPLYRSILAPRLGSMFELNAAWGPLAAGIAVAALVALYILLRRAFVEEDSAAPASDPAPTKTQTAEVKSPGTT